MENNRTINLLSVVIPLYNEEAVLEKTFSRLKESQKLWPETQFIFVDDGSTDNSNPIARAFISEQPGSELITFSRNFGHQQAVSAGLAFAKGDATVILDADLQDPPELVKDMITIWNSGIDVVYGVRSRRKGENAIKKISASLFYRFLNRLSDVKIPIDTGDFRLIDRKIVDLLNSMPERHRYLRGMVAWTGFSHAPIYFVRDERAAGETKYSTRKMIKLAINGITSFSTKPLRISIGVGISACLLAIVGITYALVIRLTTQNWVEGWTGILIAVLFMGGAQLITIGVVGEYVGMIFTENQRRPAYVIKNRFSKSPTLDIGSVDERES